MLNSTQNKFVLYSEPQLNQVSGLLSYQGKHILVNAFEMSEEEVSDLYRQIDINNTGKIYYGNQRFIHSKTLIVMM